jgi:hypothetical protein
MPGLDQPIPASSNLPMSHSAASLVRLGLQPTQRFSGAVWPASAAVVYQRRASTMTRPRARPEPICRLGASHGHFPTVLPAHGYRHIHYSRVSTQVN